MIFPDLFFFKSLKPNFHLSFSRTRKSSLCRKRIVSCYFFKMQMSFLSIFLPVLCSLLLNLWIRQMVLRQHIPYGLWKVPECAEGAGSVGGVTCPAQAWSLSPRPVPSLLLCPLKSACETPHPDLTFPIQHLCRELCKNSCQVSQRMSSGVWICNSSHYQLMSHLWKESFHLLWREWGAIWNGPR